MFLSKISRVLLNLARRESVTALGGSESWRWWEWVSLEISFFMMVVRRSTGNYYPKEMKTPRGNYSLQKATILALKVEFS